jgi:hypothetical protein
LAIGQLFLELRGSALTALKRFFAYHLFALFSLLTTSFAANAAADWVYRNGTVFTADAHGTIVQAVALRDGRIIYVGRNEGVVPVRP